jgi:hypothetical protein
MDFLLMNELKKQFEEYSKNGHNFFIDIVGELREINIHLDTINSNIFDTNIELSRIRKNLEKDSEQ